MLKVLHQVLSDYIIFFVVVVVEFEQSEAYFDFLKGLF